MSRIGSFTGPTTPFGVPTATVHPTDNNIVEDPTLAEQERLKALQDQLYQDLQNTLRDQRPEKQG